MKSYVSTHTSVSKLNIVIFDFLVCEVIVNVATAIMVDRPLATERKESKRQ